VTAAEELADLRRRLAAYVDGLRERADRIEAGDRPGARAVEVEQLRDLAIEIEAEFVMPVTAGLVRAGGGDA
jgi:hypothetical protein